MTALEKPTVEQVWGWLETLPDPEIPVLTLIDLGIIRDVEWDGDTLVVSVTPTYSGCPATSMINMDIVSHLHDHGLTKVETRMKLSPAWTTDWMTEDGRRKLEDYGIAPPQPAGGPKRCPQCGSGNVEKLSQFGSTPCKAQWRCRDCLEPFEYFKCI